MQIKGKIFFTKLNKSWQQTNDRPTQNFHYTEKKQANKRNISFTKLKKKQVANKRHKIQISKHKPLNVTKPEG